MDTALKNVRVVGSPVVLVGLVVMAVAVLMIADPFVTQMLTIALLYGFYVMSWDVLSGTTEEINFGHPFWLLAGAFTAGWLNLEFEYTAWITVPAGALVAMLLGLLAGGLTLRLRGPYFALVTLALAVTLYKLSFIWDEFFGGEEGISGVDFITESARGDYYVVLALLAVSYLLLHQYYRSRIGLILMGIKANDDITRASGHNTTFYRIMTFGIAMFFAGIAGALTAHVQGSVNSELAAGVVGTLIVLYAMIGSRGTLAGPLIAGCLFYVLDQNLRVLEEWRTIILLGSIMLAIYLFPDGVVREIQDRIRRRRLRHSPRSEAALTPEEPGSVATASSPR
ncbi:branched-chain amino acid ABC transporter permease [Blastococcus sp. SYSU DS0973]